MLWVERDLAAIVKAILDQWETAREKLLYKHLYAMDAVRTPHEICAIIEKGSNFLLSSHILKRADKNAVTGKPTRYVVLPSTGNEARDTMFNLYNLTGTYPGVKLPDPTVLDLGVDLHGAEQFVRERLVPHLQRLKESR